MLVVSFSFYFRWQTKDKKSNQKKCSRLQSVQYPRYLFSNVLFTCMHGYTVTWKRTFSQSSIQSCENCINPMIQYLTESTFAALTWSNSLLYQSIIIEAVFSWQPFQRNHSCSVFLTFWYDFGGIRPMLVRLLLYVYTPTRELQTCKLSKFLLL